MSTTWIVTALLTGLVGSLHCIGMCGPLVLGLHGQSDASIKTPLIYHSGRLLAYAILGLVLGLLGAGIALPIGQQWLSLVLGASLIIAGVIQLAGGQIRNTAFFSGPVQSAFQRVASWSGLRKQFSLGFLNGLLPCGLVYMALVGSLATADPFKGATFMALFGLATWPAMLTVSVLGAKVLSFRRLNLKRWLPVWTLVLGMLLLVRGLDLGVPYLSPELPQQVEVDEVPSCH